MLSFAISLSLLAFGPIVSARPFIYRRAISADLLSTFNLYEQWSAAAYCPWNNNSTNSKIVCSDNDCPRVQEADTDSVLEFQNTNITDTTGFLATDRTNEQIVIAFRGSEGLENLLTDVDFPLDDTDICQGCQAESGFYNAWLEIRDVLVPATMVTTKANPSYKIVTTGHSLGGALATLAATVLRNTGLDVDLVTYGCPRVGNRALAEYITNQNKGANYRITHTRDPVPRLPPEALGYLHPSPEYWITSGNDVVVTANDIEVCNGIGNSSCNSQYIVTDVEDHEWYFAQISACYGDTVEV